jgi:hypothetical protein
MQATLNRIFPGEYPEVPVGRRRLALRFGIDSRFPTRFAGANFQVPSGRWELVRPSGCRHLGV